MRNNLIESEGELRNFTRSNERCVVLFGIDDCVNCSIMENSLESLRPKYPLISLGFINNKELSEKHNITYHPTLVFYESGHYVGHCIGTGYITKLRHIFDLWFLKE